MDDSVGPDQRAVDLSEVAQVNLARHLVERVGDASVDARYIHTRGAQPRHDHLPEAPLGPRHDDTHQPLLLLHLQRGRFRGAWNYTVFLCMSIINTNLSFCQTV